MRQGTQVDSVQMPQRSTGSDAKGAVFRAAKQIMP